MAIAWSNEVNKKFYSVDISTKDNVIRTEFESGRVATIKKDSRVRKTYNVTLTLWNRAEEGAFWNWYSNDLQGGALSFELPDIMTQAEIVEYMFDDVPSVAAGSYPKELTFNMSEV